METTIEIVRWAGLLLTLGLTAVILKEVALVIRTLSGIRRLAKRIRDAARGIARHVEPAEGASALAEPVERFRAAGARFAAAAAARSDRGGSP